MRKLGLIVMFAWVLVACGAHPSPPCTPGDCLRVFDTCHGSKGQIVQNRCNRVNCEDWGAMTERDAARIDAMALCNDHDVDRQLVRIGPNMRCIDTIEYLRERCIRAHEKHPHDPFTENCETKYVRPYKHHFPTIEEYYDSVYGPPDPSKGESYP